MTTAQINPGDDGYVSLPTTEFEIETYEEGCKEELTRHLGLGFVHGSDERPVLDFSFARRRQVWTEGQLISVSLSSTHNES
jgi:hypothetical protein